MSNPKGANTPKGLAETLEARRQALRELQHRIDAIGVSDPILSKMRILRVVQENMDRLSEALINLSIVTAAVAASQKDHRPTGEERIIWFLRDAK